MRGWYHEPYRHALAAHGISTTHREEFQRRTRSIQEKVIDKFMGPLMYRDREWFIEDLENTARNLSRQEFIDSYMEAAEEHRIDITPEELSLLYTFLRGGEPYSEYGPDIRFSERGVKWPHTVNWNDFKDFEDAVHNLSPETTIKLYHGADSRFIDEILKYGIDLDVLPPTMNYPEYYVTESNMEITRRPGLYVSPNLRTAQGFGQFVLEFNIQAKFLEASNVVRQEMMKLHGIENPDEFWREVYSKSFNPLLTHNLLAPGEPQAFLKMSIKPSSILCIHAYDYGTETWNTYTPGKFLETRGDRL